VLNQKVDDILSVLSAEIKLQVEAFVIKLYEELQTTASSLLSQTQQLRTPPNHINNNNNNQNEQSNSLKAEESNEISACKMPRKDFVVVLNQTFPAPKKHLPGLFLKLYEVETTENEAARQVVVDFIKKKCTPTVFDEVRKELGLTHVNFFKLKSYQIDKD
jgi:hypothetical protein